MGRTIEALGELIAFPTVSSEPNLALIDWAAERLEAAGARVRVLTDAGGTKANLWAVMGPETGGGVLLSGHADVVPAEEEGWLSDPFRMEERDGRLYGRGACDMKGFIASALTLAGSVEAGRLRRPLWFAFTHDEEVGCLGARSLVEEVARMEARPALAIVGEPTEMRIVEGHKGCCEYTVRFRGVEGHGSRPELGVSAVEYAARYVAGLLDLRPALLARAPEQSPFVPPWTTLSVGRMAGGTARNVIAGAAEVEWEMRPVVERDRLWVLEEAGRIEARLAAEMRAQDPGAGIETEVVGEVAGLDPEGAAAARALVSRLTGQNGAETVPFSTEAGLFQALGMSVVVCGPGSIAQAHRANEYVSRTQLAQCDAMLARLGDWLVAE